MCLSKELILPGVPYNKYKSCFGLSPIKMRPVTKKFIFGSRFKPYFGRYIDLYLSSTRFLLAKRCENVFFLKKKKSYLSV